MKLRVGNQTRYLDLNNVIHSLMKQRGNTCIHKKCKQIFQSAYTKRGLTFK